MALITRRVPVVHAIEELVFVGKTSGTYTVGLVDGYGTFSNTAARTTAKTMSVSLSTELVVVICVHSSLRSNLRVLLVPQKFAQIAFIPSSPPKS